MLVATSKVDLPGSRRALAALKKRLGASHPQLAVCGLSSVTGEGVEQFRAELRRFLERAQQKQPQAVEGGEAADDRVAVTNHETLAI